MKAPTAYRVPQAPCPTDLRLDGNEGSWPPAELLAELLDDLEIDALLHHYPDTSRLAAKLAARHGLPANRVALTAGADDALDRIVRLWSDRATNVVLPEPTFVMLRHYAERAGAEIRSVPWSEGPFPQKAVLASIDAATAIVFIVSPNNPTGAVATADDLRALAAAAPHALLVLDAAYAEFAAEDLTAAALELPSALVVRTLSKAWGLAGCRTGYALGASDRVAAIAAAGPPYPVAALSAQIAERRLEQAESVAAFAQTVRDEVSDLRATLHDLGVAAPPSEANFVLGTFERSDFVHAALAGLGIAVRRFGPDDAPTLADRLRITCPGDAKSFARLRASLRTTLAPQALLFDLDGVLADVRNSYRRAIKGTAAAFGAAVGDADIEARKLRGNANDDWQLTRDLLRDRDVDVGLAAVREQFEDLYRGGLWRDEPLLTSRERLRTWATRLPLAIVTGRPRRDAEQFLAMHELTDVFETVITRNDAPLKPDPEPVRLACRRISVQHAWMVGDTPDDIAAARAAGALPIGCLPPGCQDPSLLTERLHATGAGFVLRQIDELEDLLP